MTDNANPLIYKTKGHRRSEPSLSYENFINGNTNEPIDELEIYELLKDIKDPEHPNTLEELRVIEVENISLQPLPKEYSNRVVHVVIHFTPTVPHCSMAALIGLCIRVKLMRTLPPHYRPKVYITKGTHNQEESVNKQLNDVERVAAAIENPNLRRLINSCLTFKKSR